MTNSAGGGKGRGSVMARMMSVIVCGVGREDFRVLGLFCVLFVC